MYEASGKEVTKTDIEKAVLEGRAVIHWSHGNGVNIGGLAIYEDAETANMEAERDTRGECYSMGDEVWSHLANREDALKAARGLLKTN